MCFIPRKIDPKRCGFLKIEGLLANGWNDASLIVFERRVQELYDDDTKSLKLDLGRPLIKASGAGSRNFVQCVP